MSLISDALAMSGGEPVPPISGNSFAELIKNCPVIWEKECVDGYYVKIHKVPSNKQAGFEECGVYGINTYIDGQGQTHIASKPGSVGTKFSLYPALYRNDTFLWSYKTVDCKETEVSYQLLEDGDNMKEFKYSETNVEYHGISLDSEYKNMTQYTVYLRYPYTTRTIQYFANGSVKSDITTSGALTFSATFYQRAVNVYSDMGLENLSSEVVAFCRKMLEEYVKN